MTKNYCMPDDIDSKEKHEQYLKDIGIHKFNIGDFCKVKQGATDYHAYKSISFQENIDGMFGEIVNDYTTNEQPHYEVELQNGMRVGVCIGFLIPNNNRKLSGMYGELPKIRIGNYRLSEMDNSDDGKSIWIQDINTGEGSEFQKEMFYKILADFYLKNF